MLTLGTSLLFDSYVTFLLSWVIFPDHQKVIVLSIFTSSNLDAYMIYIYIFCRFLTSFPPSSFFHPLLHHFSVFVPLICLPLKRHNIFYYLLCILILLSVIWGRYECLGTAFPSISRPPEGFVYNF